MGHVTRATFAQSHHDVQLLDANDAEGVGRYLRDRQLIEPEEAVADTARAGAGNMNLALRVRLPGRSLILKQGRPWVEKYEHIPAPWERTLIEAAFYRAIASEPALARRMPEVLHVDEHNHVLVLEDLGTAGDYTNLYKGSRPAAGDLDVLLSWLAALGTVALDDGARQTLANRAMRALNHEHIFAFPLRQENGLDLDAITHGLAAAAGELMRDPHYTARVHHLGELYLADTPFLVHGDYFPGSWVRTPRGPVVIDPEFCLTGPREFDYGVMAGHFALARMDAGAVERVMSAAREQGLDAALVRGYAGVEIMRRLIGVAQLPLPYGIAEKQRLLHLSRRLVLEPGHASPSWQ